eukprot:gene2072-316_t
MTSAAGLLALATCPVLSVAVVRGHPVALISAPHEL